MPFMVSSCKKCEFDELDDFGWHNIGEVDCPKCGAKESIEVDWQTEYGIDYDYKGDE